LLYLFHVHSLEDKLLQDEIINILPLVQNVNAMAEEMQKPVAFSIMLVSPEARGLEHGRTEVHCILVFHCKLGIAVIMRPLPLQWCQRYSVCRLSIHASMLV